MSKKLYAAFITAGLTLASCPNNIKPRVNEKPNPVPVTQTAGEKKDKELEELFNKKLEETKKKHGKKIKKLVEDYMVKLDQILAHRRPAWILEKNISKHLNYDGNASIDNKGRVAFESDRTGNLEIFMYDPATKELTQITKNNRTDKNPKIAENCIVFESLSKNSHDIHGYFLNQEQLLNLSNHKNSDSQHSLSKDGERVAFITTRNRKFQLMTGNKESLKSLNYDSSIVMNPAISNNNMVAFESLKDGRREIFVVDSEGIVRNISKHSEEDYNPDISNFGNRIVFESVRDNKNTVCIYDTSLRKVKKIDNGSNPVISGKGDIILYQKPTKDGKQEICAVKLNSHLEVIASGNISYNRANETDPAISPDGKKAAYTSDREGNQDVFTINLEKILK